MRGTHEHADNLLLRLFTYSPRKDREPLEDYCSEALAWCLDNSPEFRQRIFALTKLEALNNFEKRVQIHTQQSYKEDDVDDERASQQRIGGRFDITIEAEDYSFYVAIESKIGSSFGKGQVEKYQKRLLKVMQQGGYTACKLITLTPTRNPPVANVEHLVWGDVQMTLSETVQSENSSKGEQPSFENTVLSQFAAFLKEKGLAHMSIPKTTPDLLARFIDGMELRESMETILKSLKNAKHLATLLDRKKVKYEIDPKSKVTYLGCYGRRNPFLYLGFELDYSHSTPRLRLYIQMTLKGDKRKLSLPKELKKHSRKPYLEEKSTWFVFTQAVEGDLDGNAESMAKWFSDTSKAALLLK
jgi:hypothetical protein